MRGAKGKHWTHEGGERSRPVGPPLPSGAPRQAVAFSRELGKREVPNSSARRPQGQFVHRFDVESWAQPLPFGHRASCATQIAFDLHVIRGELENWRVVVTKAAVPARRVHPVKLGRLVVVTGADMGRVDLVVRAAVRRLPNRERLLVAETIAPHASPAGSGTVISHSAFGRLHAQGGLLLSWRQFGRTFGYPAALLDQLGLGRHVVAGLPASPEIESTLRALWRDVHVVRLVQGTHALRTALSPNACLPRVTADAPLRFKLGPELSASSEITVNDTGDLSAIIRELTVLLKAALPSVETLPAETAAARSGSPIPPLTARDRERVSAKARDLQTRTAAMVSGETRLPRAGWPT